MKDLVYQNTTGEPATTSRLIAERFKKQHKNVIRKIENLRGSTFTRLKIESSEYINKQNKPQKMYLLNKDAFMFVALGFTGAPAEAWRLEFIDDFNKMQQEINLRRLS